MRINKTVLIINILLCAILLGDAFVFPNKVKTVVLTDFSSKHTRARHTSYWNYFIHTSDNCKYEVSQGLYDALKQNDTIQVFSSRLIGMPVRINFNIDNEKHYGNIGELHTQDSEAAGLIISIVFSLIVLVLELTNRTKSKGVKLYFPLYLLAIAMSAVLLIFIIIEVSLI